MNKDDKKQLISYLEEEHKRTNLGMSINKCGYNNCWFKKIKKEIQELKEQKIKGDEI
jgi:hypothetical protein